MGINHFEKKELEYQSMSTNFLSDVWGRLSLTRASQHPSIPKEACVIMHPGKNYDGWWTGEYLFKKVRDRAISIFEAQLPTSRALFAFDNATSHAAFAIDSLVGNRMNWDQLENNQRCAMGEWKIA
ncbi:unnamed protein product [Albugo candida]|uniref:DDE-1 domain-containing protein n=1 Tax=Albugo candida TaxID=65357 RepID=A0A024G787_9STRA|nr:unnamed protein product [Albugo candida]|eukprot:CCI42191.1 unnamed protein product [Albugo candida]